MKDFWDEKYSIPDYYYGTNPNHFLESVCGALPQNAKVLCIAEGEGRNAAFLATRGFRVHAVDISDVARDKALTLAKKMGVTIDYHLGALEDFDFGIGQWDAIVSIFCFLPPETRSAVHEKIEKSIRRGGLYIIQAYDPKQLEFKTGGPKDVKMLYTEKMIKDDFKNIEWVKLETTIEDIFEGIGHHGKSSVVSGLGIKKG